MKRALALAILAAASFVIATNAQQAGHNTPVLPGVPADPNDPQAHLKSDLLEQGQVENTIVVSTRDWSNLAYAFNDYRKVHISDRETPGGTEIAAHRPGRLERFLAWVTGRPVKQPPERRAASPNEASVGLAFSYDGGLTFTGAVLQPIENLDAMSDPHWAAAPCGIGYLALIAFNRGTNGRSVIAVVKYEDLALPGGDSWTNRGYSIVEDNTGSPQVFHDLPWIIADPVRTPTGDPCAHNLYVGWARFGSSTQPVKMRFAKSTDGGQTWTNKDIAWPYKTGQRVVIDVDKRPGRPQTGGGGTVYYGFRSFKTSPNDAPPGMWVAQSINSGDTFTPAVRVNTTTMYPFDQPAYGTDYDQSGASLAFRSNAFMTLQSVPISSGVSRLFAAWAERSVMPPNPPPTGPCPAVPNPNGEPRIFYTYSDDHGRSWRPRKALDCGQRDVGSGAPPPGFGFLPQGRNAGPQFQPHLTFGGGRLGAFYYESRNALTLVDGSLLIAGRGNHIDARFALINPATPTTIPSFAGTNQVSRYPVKFQADLNDGEGIDDIYEVVPGQPGMPGVPAINNRGTEPTRKDGTTPFIGDYPGAVPVVSLIPVRNASGAVTSWKWAITPADVPFQGFRVGFADSRNQIPADLNDYPNYAPPSCPGCDPPVIHPDPAPECTTAGSRNLDVMHALVDARVGVNAASTFERLTFIARNFPLTITNGFGSDKTYQLTLTNQTPTGTTVASFDQDDGIAVGNTNPPVTSLVVALFPYSSTTRVVTMKGTLETASVRVNLVEVTCNANLTSCSPTPGGQTGSATLNLDPSTPIAGSDDETHAPGVKGPGVKGYALSPGVKGPGVKGQALNPGVKGPGVKGNAPEDSTNPNDSLSNALIQNPALNAALDADKEVHAVIDVTWEVTGGGTDAASLFSHFNIENPAVLDENYVFHLLIHRQSAFAALNLANCTTQNGFLDQVVSSVPMSPLADNDLINNPGVKGDALNPGVKGGTITNATFAVAPSDSGSSGSSASAMTPTAVSRSTGSSAGNIDSLITMAGLPSLAIAHGDTRDSYKDVVFVTLRAYQLAADIDIPENKKFRPKANPPVLEVDSLIKDTRDGAVQAETNSAVSGASAFLSTDFRSEGARDLREGTGSIDLFIPSGSTITKALLYWHGPTNSWDPTVNATVMIDETEITGTNIGISHDNIWGFANSQAYVADVTSLVSAGESSYSLSGFRKFGDDEIIAMANGASLLVFYDDGNTLNNKDVYLKDGSDSTCGTAGNDTFDGWSIATSAVTSVPPGRAVRLELHVSDGQNFGPDRQYEGPELDDGALFLNGTQFQPAGENFDGNSLGETDNGLWDIRQFTVTDLINMASPNRLTSPHVFDCLSAIVTLLIVEIDG